MSRASTGTGSSCAVKKSSVMGPSGGAFLFLDGKGSCANADGFVFALNDLVGVDVPFNLGIVAIQKFARTLLDHCYRIYRYTYFTA
jgi:hypothetical protein